MRIVDDVNIITFCTSTILRITFFCIIISDFPTPTHLDPASNREHKPGQRLEPS